jgi:hypothetical protein
MREKPKTMKVLIVLMMLVGLNAYARLGEDLETCKKRYGQVVAVDADIGLHAFNKAGFTVMVFIWKGKCHCISFLRIDKKLSEAEILKFLELNGLGKKWIEKKAFMERNWYTSDKNLTAWLNSDGKGIGICTMSYAFHTSHEKDKKDRNNLDGF